MSIKTILLRLPGARRLRRAYRTEKAKRNYKKAVTIADRHYATTGKRHFVIMLTNGRLAIYNRQTFREHKKRNFLPNVKDVKMLDLLRDCVYRTPANAQDPGLPQNEANIRRNQYIYYYSTM